MTAAFIVGYWSRGAAAYSAEAYSTVSNAVPDRFREVNLTPFWESLGVVQDKFVGDVDLKKAVDGAIAGMVASLDDQFSVYISKDGLKTFNDELNGTFEGIGAEITVKEGRLVVVSPLEGSPSEKAGMKAGDEIVTIDGQKVDGLTLEQAIGKIRGKKGSTVKISVYRESTKSSLDLAVLRDTIVVKSVSYEKKGEIAYIKIARFDGATTSLLKKFLVQAKADQTKGLILDVRNNPGGYLDAAIEGASQFIRDGVVVREQYKGGREDQHKVTGYGEYFDLPMVVLVNGGSASASEILAGAIKDTNRGTVIGEKTFGKGSVQEIVQLARGDAIKITIAKWLTPNGHKLDKNGLDPDIVVPLKDPRAKGADDVQLMRAMEVMKDKVGIK